MTFIQNQTSVTIHIEVISHLRGAELLLKPLAPGNFDYFEVGQNIHIFSDIGSCAALMVYKQLSDITNFGKLVLEEGPSKNLGNSLLVREIEA